MNLRLPWLDMILEQKPDLPCLEIIVDNWLSPGPHHSKLEKVREDYPILFHCVGMNIGGEDPLDLEYLAKIRELKNRYEPVHLSDHLCFQRHRSHHFHDLLPIPFHQKSMNNCRERIESIQDFFATGILLENLSYYVEYENSELTEMSFITELCQQTESRMLLDLNNLWVNQENLGHSLPDALKDVDLSLVGEIHLAGPDRQGDFYVDTHGSEVVDEVRDMFLDVIQRVGRSIPVIYERDNELPEFEEMIAICQGLGDGFGKH